MDVIVYELMEAGWARLHVTFGDKTRTLYASYFHDTIKDLIESATASLDNVNTQVLVYDEPGVYLLELTQGAESEDMVVTIKGNYYAFWDESDLSIIDQATVLRNDYVIAVYNSVRSIYQTYGCEGYLDRWSESDFPLRLYREMCRELGEDY